MHHRGEYKVPGGKLVVAEFAIIEGRLRNVRITGDFFLFPEDAIHLFSNAFEGALAELPNDKLVALVNSTLNADVEMLGFGPEDVVEAIRRGLP